jgi:predicted nucleic acid-binding protein
MRILIDTNVLLDALLGREPHFENADKILELCATRKVQGCIAAHSIPNMFYILRKDMSEADRRDVLSNFCVILSVEGVDSAKVSAVLKNSDFSDLEDCLQAECAESAAADYIVTRNVKDFKMSNVHAITPREFLDLWDRR